ncbi:hypothetical protein ACT3TE_11055 [Brachybacterium sp. AOP42-B2-9]|uniref:hypothetical protein n=1 Tax=Brachybacterium sp. AOP42-B2-9 TaxID=3457672 RepID=UPI0040335B31
MLEAYAGGWDGLVVVDVSNSLDFASFDELVVLAGSSAASEIQKKIPGGHRAEGLQHHVHRGPGQREGG